MRLPVLIEEEMKESYLDYAMSVIIGRALPDVRDGLKPVQRRILYAMFKEGLLPGRRYSKCAGVVGEVLKKYHPHGDSAVYDALVRLAQDFNMRYPLIDGQGNFGSLDGDPAAAYRYTEARLTRIAEEMLKDIDKETVDFIPNFDDTTNEPSVLPTMIPNLLINGSSGIAVGMATNIPPHNLKEIIDALIMLIDKPDCSIEELMKKVKGPDFPTGGVIHGIDGITDAYLYGRGSIKIRAKAHIEKPVKGNQLIVITELPFQVNKARLVEKIASQVKNKKIMGILEIRDESDRDGIRVVLELKKGEVPQVILNNLYKQTQMEITYGIIMLALVSGQPRVMNLKDLLSHFLQHRKEVILRRTKFELKKAEHKAHIFIGFKIALEWIDEIINIIKTSNTPENAKNLLINRYSLTELQAQAILDMKLQRLTGLERSRIVKEYDETLKEIEKLKAILKDEALLNQIIKDELIQIKHQYGDERKTEILKETEEITIEDLITEEEMVITFSHAGYIKRNPLSEYRSQRRGGKGLIGMETKEEDYVEHIFIGSTHDYIFFFTNHGKLHWLKIYQIPEASRTSKGKPIVNLLSLQEGERVTTAISIRDRSEGYLVMFTKNGIVKKTSLNEFRNPRGRGVIAISLKEKDELISVKMITNTEDLFIGTRNGLVIRFSEKDVRPTGRTAKGVRGIKLTKGDNVVSADVLQQGTTLLTVTEKGYGKRTEIKEYPIHSRGGKGVISIKVNEKIGKAVGILQVKEDDEIVLITFLGKIIRIKAGNIPIIGRNTQGVKLMDLTKIDKIVSLGRVHNNTVHLRGDGYI